MSLPRYGFCAYVCTHMCMRAHAHHMYKKSGMAQQSDQVLFRPYVYVHTYIHMYTDMHIFMYEQVKMVDKHGRRLATHTHTYIRTYVHTDLHNIYA